MTKKTLTASLAGETRKTVEAAREAAAAKLAVAKAWDDADLDFRNPDFVVPSTLYGSVGTLIWNAVQPDELVQLMQLLPAEPCIFYRDGCSYWHPEGARQLREGLVTHRDLGYEIALGGGYDYGKKLDANWYVRLGGVRLQITCHLTMLPGLHPTLYRKPVLSFGRDFVRYEGRSEVVWPEQVAEQSREVLAGADIRCHIYGVTDQQLGDVRFRGRDVPALAKLWEAEANRRQESTRSAFLAAWAAVDGRLPTAEEIDQQAEILADRYKYSRLRAGTLRQAACLKTPAALADKAVAEKHWPAYCSRLGIDSSRTYFDHYAWACSFLQRCGLYEVEHDGSTYRYGTAWL